MPGCVIMAPVNFQTTGCAIHKNLTIGDALTDAYIEEIQHLMPSLRP
jgi:hypothetical protein